jgi:hypothetical protein
LDNITSGGIDTPVPPTGSGIYVLACQGGFLFWMQTEECE